MNTIQKIVAIGLLRYAFGSKTVVFPTQATLAEALVINRSTVGAAIKVLLDFGLISLQPNAGRNLKYDISALRDETAVKQLCWPAEQLMPAAGLSNVGDADITSARSTDTKNTETDRSTYDLKNTEFQDTEDLSFRQQDKLSVGIVDDSNAQDQAIITQYGDVAPADNSDFSGPPVRGSDASTGLVVAEEGAAIGDIDSAVAICGGGAFNRGALERLIAKHGIETCWLQSKVLAYRLSRAPSSVCNPTAYYIKSVREDWTIPADLVDAVSAGHDVAAKYVEKVQGARYGILSHEDDDAIPF